MYANGHIHMPNMVVQGQKYIKHTHTQTHTQKNTHTHKHTGTLTVQESASCLKIYIKNKCMKKIYVCIWTHTQANHGCVGAGIYKTHTNTHTDKHTHTNIQAH